MRKISIERAIISLKFKSFTTTKNWFSVWLTHTRDVYVYEELLLALTEREKMMFNQRCDLWNDQTSFFIDVWRRYLFCLLMRRFRSSNIWSSSIEDIFFSASADWQDKRARDSLKKAIQFAFQFYVNSRWESRACVNFFQRKIYIIFWSVFSEFCAIEIVLWLFQLKLNVVTIPRHFVRRILWRRIELRLKVKLFRLLFMLH